MAKPKIRFNGYTEDWEQRKLDDVFKEYSEKNHTELPALTIIQGGGTVKREESDRNLMYDESNLSNYKMVRKNDFIVHLRSFEGGLEKSSLDGIISPAYHTFHSDVADSRFYYSYFRSHEFIKHKLVPHVYGIRDGRSIDITGMKTIEIPYTSMEEQRKIGDYLEFLDHLITLHQRKCEQTKTLKKYMLQKMFPQDGEKVPQIRFEGFTEDWEQRKFGELYEKVNEKNDLSFGADKIISVANMYFKEEVKESNDDYMRTYNVMRLGDIAFEGNKSKNFSHGRFVENTIGDGIVSHVFDVFRPVMNYDLLFWKYLINNENVMGRIMTRCTKASTMMTNLVAKDFLNEDILIPTIEEQSKIGECIDKIDHLITLHQRKCDELKEVKKFMLQNMFV